MNLGNKFAVKDPLTYQRDDLQPLQVFGISQVLAAFVYCASGVFKSLEVEQIERDESFPVAIIHPFQSLFG